MDSNRSRTTPRKVPALNVFFQTSNRIAEEEVATQLLWHQQRQKMAEVFATRPYACLADT